MIREVGFSGICRRKLESWVFLEMGVCEKSPSFQDILGDLVIKKVIRVLEKWVSMNFVEEN